MREGCKSDAEAVWIALRVNAEILLSQAIFREFSSAGSEHLPYKQRVGGSNPSTPTSEAKSQTKPLNRVAFVVSVAMGACSQIATDATKMVVHSTTLSAILFPRGQTDRGTLYHAR